jgi:S1-C subfamily serine protease
MSIEERTITTKNGTVTGTFISEISAGSAASKCGLLIDDLITKVSDYFD